MKIYCLILICLCTVKHSVNIIKQVDNGTGTDVLASIIVTASYILGIIFMAKIL